MNHIYNKELVVLRKLFLILVLFSLIGCVNQPNDEKIIDAINLSSSDYYASNEYSNQMVGMLETGSRVHYYFNLLNTSSVSIGVNSYPSSISIKIRRFTNQEDEVYCYNETGNKNEYIDTLSAGTYYVLLENNSSSEIEYALNFSVEKENENNTVDLVDLRLNKGLKGTIWISDYLPLGESMLINFNSKIKVSKDDRLISDIAEIADGKPINYANIYLWDNVLIENLSNVFDTVLSIIDERKETDEIRLSFVYDEETEAIVVSALVGKEKVTKEINILEENGFIVEFICKAIIPSIVNKSKFIGYFTIQIQAICFEKEKNENVIVKIPLSYNFVSKKGDTDLFVERLIGNPTYYQERYANAKGICEGNFFDISVADNSINSINNLKQVEEITTNISPKVVEVIVDVPHTLSMIDGEYIWYKFTALKQGQYRLIAINEEASLIDIFVSDEVMSGYVQGKLDFLSIEFIKGDKSIGSYYNIEMYANETVYICIQMHADVFVKSPTSFSVCEIN